MMRNPECLDGDFTLRGHFRAPVGIGFDADERLADGTQRCLVLLEPDRAMLAVVVAFVGIEFDVDDHERLAVAHQRVDLAFSGRVARRRVFGAKHADRKEMDVV